MTDEEWLRKQLKAIGDDIEIPDRLAEIQARIERERMAKKAPETKFHSATEKEPEWMTSGRKYAEGLAQDRIATMEHQIRIALRQYGKWLPNEGQ